MTINLKTTTKYLLAVDIFLIPFYIFRFSIAGVPTNVFELAVFLSLIVFAISGAITRSRIRDFILPILLTLVALASVFIAPDKSKALGIFKGWFVVPIIFSWMISVTFNKRNAKVLLWPVFLSLLLVSIYAILQRAGVIGLHFYQTQIDFSNYLQFGRAFGSFESPNYLAMFIVPTFFLSLHLIDEVKDRAYRLSMCAGLILPLLALWLTHSRGGLVALVIAGAFYINYRFINNQKSSDRRPLFSWLIVTLIVLVNFSYIFIFNKASVMDSGSDTSRKEIYTYTGTMLKSHFVFGIGLGSFEQEIDRLSVGDESFRQTTLSYALHPHNLLLAIWLNLGLIGLILFLWLIIEFIQRCFTIDSHIRASLIAAMAAIIVHGIFDTTYFKNDLSAIFWLLFALAVISGRENEAN